MKTTGNFFLLFVIIHLSSCVNTRPIQYVQGQFDTAALTNFVVKAPVIQRGDLISIIVYSDNPQATSLYNLPNVAGSIQGLTGGGQGGIATAGYLVDDQGNVQFQGIGNLHIEGLTKQQLTVLLDTKLKEFLQNPYYTIRFLNYKITLIGEVSREGVYTVPNERVNILEAIGLAGGLSIYARRENVMVIREANGKREFARLDLTSPEIFKSPYYFLQQNDLIVVEQIRSKSALNDQVTVRNISLGATIVSTVAILISVLRR